MQGLNHRERLVRHVQELERLVHDREIATEVLKEAFDLAKADGYDPATLRVVLKLRKMTPEQRRERRALEAIYMAALGMLEGDPLTDEARKRLDGPRPMPKPPKPGPDGGTPADAPELPPSPTSEAPQPTLPLKEPAEARAEGAAAAVAGKRVYDNPYPAGDPCRAAWDEGWCTQSNSHGMDTPTAYQRRTTKPADQDEKSSADGKDDHASDDAKKGAA